MGAVDVELVEPDPTSRGHVRAKRRPTDDGPAIECNQGRLGSELLGELMNRWGPGLERALTGEDRLIKNRRDRLRVLGRSGPDLDVGSLAVLLAGKRLLK